METNWLCSALASWWRLIANEGADIVALPMKAATKAKVIVFMVILRSGPPAISETFFVDCTSCYDESVT